MDFSVSEAQQEITALARRILTDRVTQERLREVEAGGDHFDRALWKELAAAGMLDEELGLPEQCSVLIEIGRAAAPVPYLWSAVARTALKHNGAPVPAADAVLTVALAPGEVTADAGPVLHGSVGPVPAGPTADLILLPAAGRLFLVSPDDDGVTITRQRIVDGSDEGLLRLDGVRVADDRVIDAPDAAAWLRRSAIAGLCAHQLGVAERALEMTARYATERVQFGRPIGTFQAVAQRLADAYIDVEAIRLTMWQAVWRLAEGRPCDAEIATAKFWAADAGHRVAHTAVHVHGGVGIDVDYPLHRYFVAAKRNEFALGHATAHLLTLGTILAGR